ncbi:MAG: urate hydroxylase PuuD [Elusimicrobia bacterium]|nr:urate hydroxylase PuuD [Elusimicrobiota bacterium]
MAYNDLFTNLHLIIRWLHVIAGITWIGHLYFFNFVNVPLQGALDDAVKKAVNPKLMPRALWWFRWGAMVTFLAGLTLFTLNYMYVPGLGFGPSPLFSDAEGITDRAIWVLMGMFLGSVMWFNVWFIIWPIQKRILSGQARPEELPVLRRRATWVSRANTILSGPMLFGMLAPSHYGSINAVTVVVFILLGAIPLHWAIRASYKVGASV